MYAINDGGALETAAARVGRVRGGRPDGFCGVHGDAELPPVRGEYREVAYVDPPVAVEVGVELRHSATEVPTWRLLPVLAGQDRQVNHVDAAVHVDVAEDALVGGVDEPVWPRRRHRAPGSGDLRDRLLAGFVEAVVVLAEENRVPGLRVVGRALDVRDMPVLAVGEDRDRPGRGCVVGDERGPSRRRVLGDGAPVARVRAAISGRLTPLCASR